MIGNIADSTARARSARTALGGRHLGLLRAVVCFGILASVTAGLPVAAKEAAATTIAGAQDSLAAGKRPHIRQPVSASQAPYQAVGRVLGSKICSGAIMVHPRIVVTAAHCVLGTTTAGPPRILAFEQWDQVAGGVRRFEAKIKEVGSQHQNGAQTVHDASQDWAVLLLDEAPQGVRPLEIAEYTPPELRSKPGRISLPTYAGDDDEDTLISVDPSCSIQDFRWEVLVHDCSSGRTGSGAPLLLDDGVCSRVVGIQSGTLLVDVDGGRMLKPMGNSAVGTWNFVSTVRALAHHLESSGGHAEACLLETAGSRTSLRAAAAHSER